jgi:glycosyltransferase involved in cell wall biosynthesis
MARAARAAGFEVHVATQVADGAAAIQSEGFILHPVPFTRGRLSPRGSIATVRALRRIHRAIAPAITHHVAIQAAVLGSLATIGLPVASVNAMTGLGYTFTSGSAKAMLLRLVMGTALRILFNRPQRIVLVQNPDDRANMVGLGIAPERIALIPGSGVDVEVLRALPEPQGLPTVAFVGRLLTDKGIRILVAAHRLLRQRGSDVELLIAGTPDPDNPGSVDEAEATAWSRDPGICWLRHVPDITSVWERAHIAVLPSRREGLPKSLLEAAACGRPMIASDVPGCREVVRPGETGILVPPDQSEALAAAIDQLASAPDLRARYGTAARQLAVERFSADAIGAQTVDLYRHLVKSGAGHNRAANAAMIRS